MLKKLVLCLAFVVMFQAFAGAGLAQSYEIPPSTGLPQDHGGSR